MGQVPETVDLFIEVVSIAQERRIRITSESVHQAFWLVQGQVAPLPSPTLNL